MSFLSLPPGVAARPTIAGVSVVTDLRSVLPSSLFAAGMRAETSAGVFRWDAASLAADDGVTVLRPTDVPAPNPGRWLKLGSSGGNDLQFELSGVYSGAVVPGFFAPPVIAEVGFTLDHAFLQRRTAGTAGATSVDILKNGASIIAGLTPRVTAAAGDYASAVGNSFNPGANVFVPGDVLEVQLVLVETFKAGPPQGPEGFRVTLVKV